MRYLLWAALSSESTIADGLLGILFSFSNCLRGLGSSSRHRGIDTAAANESVKGFNALRKKVKHTGKWHSLAHPSLPPPWPPTSSVQ